MKMQKMMNDRDKDEKKKEHNLQLKLEATNHKIQKRKEFLMEKAMKAKKIGNLKEYGEYKEQYEDEFEAECDIGDIKNNNSQNVKSKTLTRSSSVGKMEDEAKRKEEKRKREEYVEWVHEQDELDKQEKAK